MTSVEACDNALDLWEQLKKKSGFNQASYDEPLVERLLSTYGVDDIKSFEDKLYKEISAESFLEVFFSAVQPFSEMMSDILKVFEDHGANRSTDSIVVQKTKKGGTPKRPLKFNLSSFSQFQESLVMLKYSDVYVLDNQTIDAIESIRYSDKYNKKVMNATYHNWVEKYMHGDVWPALVASDLPYTGDIEFDTIIHELFIVLLQIYNEYQRIAKSPDQLHQLIRNSFIKESTIESDISFMLQRESDYWLSWFVKAIFLHVEEYPELNEDERFTIKQELQEILKSINKQAVEKEQIIKRFQEVLSLPVWKHRHQVYAIWVFSQIASAFDPKDISVRHHDGQITFTLNTVLADCQGIDQYSLMTERRTNCIIPPIGKGRTEGIQPDYSLVSANTEPDAGSAVLVVECKQYKNQSIKNFSQALIDYSRNNPSADVILVNYGPLNEQKILAKILDFAGEECFRRCKLFGHFYPGMPAQHDFRTYIRQRIYQGIDVKIQQPAYFTVWWDEKPSDLDICLEFMPEEKSSTMLLNYSTADIPDAMISRDLQTGCGNESIYISCWHKGIYHLKINNFSRSPEMGRHHIVVFAYFSDMHKVYHFESPQQDGNSDWPILTINTVKNTIRFLTPLQSN